MPNTKKSSKNTSKIRLAATLTEGWGVASARSAVIAGTIILLVALSFFSYLVGIAGSFIEGGRGKTESVDIQPTSYPLQKKLPVSFPTEFPIYDAATLQDSWTTQSAGITGVSVVWLTNEPFLKVFNFYFTELSSKGFKVEVLSKTKTSSTLSFLKDNVSGFVGISESDGETSISVTLGIKNAN